MCAQGHSCDWSVNSNQISAMYYSVFMMVNLYSAPEAALIPLKCFLNAVWECHRAQAACGTSSSRSSVSRAESPTSAALPHSHFIAAIGYQPDFFLALGVGEVREITQSNAFNWRSQVLSKHCCELVRAVSICTPVLWMSTWHLWEQHHSVGLVDNRA